MGEKNKVCLHVTEVYPDYRIFGEEELSGGREIELTDEELKLVKKSEELWKKKQELLVEKEKELEEAEG